MTLSYSPHSPYVPLQGEPYGVQTSARAPLRREELLAFIVERLARGQACPSYAEMGRAIGVSETRARQLVDQLIRDGVIRRTTGLQRNLVLRDVTHCREVVTEALRRANWQAADPRGELLGHCAIAQLPIVAVLGHVPDDSGVPHAASINSAAG